MIIDDINNIVCFFTDDHVFYRIIVAQQFITDNKLENAIICWIRHREDGGGCIEICNNQIIVNKLGLAVFIPKKK